jgi:lipoprotein-releasing system permease protein
MYFRFAWRYFKAKKSANAINIIAWVTTIVIAFATCCQILVLSIFNGFEDLVQSLYASFYSDIKITPDNGKTFVLDANAILKLKSIQNIEVLSTVVEEKALLQQLEFQTVLQLKGVDSSYNKIGGFSSKIIQGKYDIGNMQNPKIIVGYGVQNAIGISVDESTVPEKLIVMMPKKNNTNNDPISSISEGGILASGVFAIQQDFDNSYALTNIDFVKQQLGLAENEFTSVEIKFKNYKQEKLTREQIRKILPQHFVIQNRYEQNATLYNTMVTEKWAIYLLLTLILIIASFNIISSLTMLVLEKKFDIGLLKSLGANTSQVQKIFLAEGLLIGLIGTILGTVLAIIICVMQLKFKLIKIEGGSFLINYFPVKMMPTDFILVISTSIFISLLAAWIPSRKAANTDIIQN